MFEWLIKIFGSKNEREIKRLKPTVEKICSLEAKYAALSDADLKQVTPRFKEMIENGAGLDDILPDAFAERDN